MASEHLSGNGYSPLPQSISNTDSEDEDDHLNGNNHSIHRDSDDMTMTVCTSFACNYKYSSPGLN